MTMTKRAQELLERARRGEDISDEPGVGPWTVDTAPMAPSSHPDGSVTVGKSVRLTLDLVEQIQAVAEAQGTDFSKLLRRWVLEGLEREKGQTDPFAELARIQELAGHVAQVWKQREAA